MNRKRQAGEGKLKAVIVFAVLGYLIFCTFRVAPAFMDDYQLKDALLTEVRMALAQHKAIDLVRMSVEKKIKELEIPAKKEAIRITDTGNGLRIEVKYSITFDLLVYKWTHDFTPSSEERRVL
ncbi:MAG: hypothetical protein HY046_14610 [Acidobacteria bacterium]|nr:hypothetical protein [Acidobacteriota bacterium]